VGTIGRIGSMSILEKNERIERHLVLVTGEEAESPCEASLK
jgi:hypothetical protein